MIKSGEISPPHKKRHKGSAFSIIAEISFYIFNEKGEKMFPAWLVC